MNIHGAFFCQYLLYLHSLARQFNKRHMKGELSKLSTGESVWITDLRTYEKIFFSGGT